jgi:hypothetical protein
MGHWVAISNSSSRLMGCNFNYSEISNTTMRIMPQAKGKANYKVETLIQVVEEKLPNGAQGW